LSDIPENLARVHQRVVEACGRAQRDPQGVTLIAVSKSVSVDQIRVAYEAGQRHFGESRLQEAIPKIESLPSDIVWHFIGPLQSNKAKRISELFDLIHSFDSEQQVRQASKAANPAAGLIQVNVALEEQKAGVSPSQETIRPLRSLMLDSGIACQGLMTIGPDIGAEKMRPFFRKLKELSELSFPGMGPFLSMGMSGDYEVAIEEGATHVRVGSAIFGSR